MILTADWHLVDTPSEEYRWNVFNELKDYINEREDTEVFILGDLTDRKDRHSAQLVNRLISEFLKLFKEIEYLEISIIMGNHDAPLKGTPFWEFLSNIHKRLKFYTKPSHKHGGELILLPFDPNMADTWPPIFEAGAYKAAFIHQPVNGAELESGRKYEGAADLPIPRNVKIYAGDIHTPQQVKQSRVTYVGAPHPIDFGDDYMCRMIALDNDYKITHQKILRPPRKLYLKVSSLDALETTEIIPGDQVKIQYTVDANKMQLWPAEQQAIADWAKTAAPGQEPVSVVSVEPVVVFTTADEKQDVAGMSTTPEEALDVYIENEGVPPKLAAFGRDILTGVRNARDSA